MTPSRHARRLVLCRSDGQLFEAWLAVASAGDLYETRLRTWLHPDEAARLSEMQTPARRDRYLLGRLAAKRAIAGWKGAATTDEMPTVAILEGVFGQPVVAGDVAQAIPPRIGIAHSRGCAVALACSPLHPMGIDVETVDEAGARAVRSQATAGEHALLDAMWLAEADACTLLWTVKEALAKTLTTGLMCPLWLYDVESIERENDFVVATYSNFPQYRALAFTLSPNVRCAIALPKFSRCLTDAAALRIGTATGA